MRKTRMFTCSGCARYRLFYAKNLCASCFNGQLRRAGRIGTRTRMFTCSDCATYQPFYAKNLCRQCYHYQLLHAERKRRGITPRVPVVPKYCEICLELFRPFTMKQRFCSVQCRGLYARYRTFRGRVFTCQRCEQVRIIRSKKLCASCYVLARLEMNALGMYGQCASKINRLVGNKRA